MALLTFMISLFFGEHGDKLCLLTLMKTVSNILTSNWGTQSQSQVVVFSDCGLGFGKSSIRTFLQNYTGKELDAEFNWLKPLKIVKWNFICLGIQNDGYFTMFEMFEKLCESNFKPFEVTLKCGDYIRLECPILIWPPLAPYYPLNNSKNAKPLILASKLGVCGYLSLSDIGSPASLSRHLILPKMEKVSRPTSDKSANTARLTSDKTPRLDINGTQPHRISSFKITVPSEQFECATDKPLRPDGVLLKEFNPRKKPTKPLLAGFATSAKPSTSTCNPRSVSKD
uniref:Integrator complex subunit 14 beta-barrel domain-containing protein n=1 Tax=Glossina palpalis gambiensis TaxID=67801 RepID=A0A1B0BLK4_9MUSC